MKVDIPTKGMVKTMVDRAVRKEMGGIYAMFDKFKERIAELEERVRKLS